MQLAIQMLSNTVFGTTFKDAGRCLSLSTAAAVIAGAKARVLELLQFVRGYDSEKALSKPELVIDGRTLGFILGAFALYRLQAFHALGIGL